MKKLNTGITEKDGKYFFLGNEISKYGVKMGRVDYKCLAKCGRMIMNNKIVQTLEDAGIFPELLQGNDCDEETDETLEINQYYIIDQELKETLETYFPNEIVYFYEKEDLIIWGAMHYGTSWEYIIQEITNPRISWAQVPTKYNIFTNEEGEN